MADDFQVGDVVVCINDDICPVVGGQHSYRKGAIYRVAIVRTVKDYLGRPATGLKAVGLENEAGRNIICFRKLPKADEQFTADMRACRPHRNRVPA